MWLLTNNRILTTYHMFINALMIEHFGFGQELVIKKNQNTDTQYKTLQFSLPCLMVTRLTFL